MYLFLNFEVATVLNKNRRLFLTCLNILTPMRRYIMNINERDKQGHQGSFEKDRQNQGSQSQRTPQPGRESEQHQRRDDLSQTEGQSRQGSQGSHQGSHQGSQSGQNRNK